MEGARRTAFKCKHQPCACPNQADNSLANRANLLFHDLHQQCTLRPRSPCIQLKQHNTHQNHGSPGAAPDKDDFLLYMTDLNLGSEITSTKCCITFLDEARRRVPERPQQSPASLQFVKARVASLSFLFGFSTLNSKADFFWLWVQGLMILLREDSHFHMLTLIILGASKKAKGTSKSSWKATHSRARQIQGK